MKNYKKASIASLTTCLSFVSSSNLFAAGCVGAEAEKADAAYQSGFAQYRDGHLDAAYEHLKSAYGLCSASERYRNDFLVAAVSDGYAEEALAIAAQLDVAALPPYVIEALGRGARDRHQPDLAIHYYNAILAAGENVGVRVGRDLAVIDQGRAGEAQADLLDLNARFPQRIDVLEALGLAEEAQGQSVPALAAAEALLQLDPQHAGALALRYRVLVNIGAPQLAAALTPETVTTAAQRSATLQIDLAFEFRWARDEVRADRIRAAHLDAVIARMREAVSDPSTSAGARQALRADLIEALQERGHSREAVAEYESMRGDGIAVPPHAIGAAVDAYLTLRQPERSITLFRSLPPDSKPSFGVKSSYFYALLESGRYLDAIAWADGLAAREPMYLDAGTPGLRSENENYVKALVLAGLVPWVSGSCGFTCGCRSWD